MNLIVGITEAAGSNLEWIKEQFFKKESEELGSGIYDFMAVAPTQADVPR